MYDHTNERYARQVPLKGFGPVGQQKLIESKVLVVGAGGLGSPIITYLAGAGVGTVDVMDSDVVEVTNLHRQVMHGRDTVGLPKAASAIHRIHDLNDNVRAMAIVSRLTAENVLDTIKDYDMVVSAVDNFKTKYLINDACVLLGKPFSHCGVVGWAGQVFTHMPNGPCLRCILPEPPPAELSPTCVKVGLLGPSPGILGCIQALDVCKYLGEHSEDLHTLTDRMVNFDLLRMEMKTIRVAKDPFCPVCGLNPSIKEVREIEIPKLEGGL